ncbi:hypothetical protein ASG84_05240 [Rhodococcus sp. Leaf278]|uniref:hypothetical protein n=1 Tax=Rhodococcus sp. Leaf278 TaxID=1736319 RepID=UPI0007095B4C|nr:hypothetical protein [Rhodococcus sp. Leaf278]KQU49354.1 hypothetical protein ASG84_05240 [Rhodococcus sp. Leaf278]
MRNLVILLLLFGFIVGLAPLGWYLIGDWTTDLDDVVYQGSYEPLEGVTMSRGYSTDLGRDLNYDPLILRSAWLYLVPVATGALGALTGFVLGQFGFRLNRNRIRDA